MSFNACHKILSVQFIRCSGCSCQNGSLSRTALLGSRGGYCGKTAERPYYASYLSNPVNSQEGSSRLLHLAAPISQIWWQNKGNYVGCHIFVSPDPTFSIFVHRSVFANNGGVLREIAAYRQSRKYAASSDEPEFGAGTLLTHL